MDKHPVWDNINEAFAYRDDESREDYEERMRSKGCSIFYPKDNQLQIDIDSYEQGERFVLNLNLLRDNIKNIEIVKDVPSKSGEDHRHITIELPFKITDIERVAFQAALGSDPRRELLSILRILKGDSKPTLFAEI